MDEKKRNDIYNEKYKTLKNKIEETINSCLDLKNVDFENQDLNKFEKSEFLLFENISKLIPCIIDYIGNKDILQNLSNIKINNNKLKENRNIYKLFLHMQIYLLKKIEIIIELYEKNIEEYQLIKKEIGQSYFFLIQIFIFMSKLYKEKIFDIKKILLYINILKIFICKKNSYNDKVTKLKKIIFIELLMENYFEYFLILLLNNNNNENKNDIITFFEYIINNLNSDEFKTEFNYEILVKNNIIEKFIYIVLNNIDYHTNIDIYNKFKDKLIASFANIYKHNIKRFNFFEIIINQNKKSFINLMNYETRKDIIIKDMFIQNFYIELLHKIFLKEKNGIDNIKKEDNYFLFNGYNSKITLDLNEFSLNNTNIIFSFKLSKDINNLNSNIFPLIYLQSKSNKKIIFKLYIQKEQNINRLCLYQEKDNTKKKTLKFDKLENIQFDTNYILSINSVKRKISIYMIKLNKKNENFFDEVDLYDVDNQTPIIKIGHADNEKEYFKGYIGSIIIMRNLDIKKNCNIKDINNNILDLKNLYTYFPLFLSESSVFNFHQNIYFSSDNDEKEFVKIKDFLISNIEKCQFELFITPEYLGIYNDFFLNNKKEQNYYLVDVPNITSNQKYKIVELNISLVNKSEIIIESLRNNILDYFILIFEYYYHFFKIIESNQKEFDFFFNNIDIKNTPFESIYNILLILNNYKNSYKYIISNITKYKTLYRNLYEILKFKKCEILSKIISELYGFYLELNNISNTLNKLYEASCDEALDEHIKIISNFSKGLVDILCDNEIYLKSKNNETLNNLFKFCKRILEDYKNNYSYKKEFL